MADLVLTSYFTNEVDAQRGTAYPADVTKIQKLATSCQKHGKRLVVLNDCFDEGEHDGAELVRVNPVRNPYFARWEEQAKYLYVHPEVTKVWMVDSTDVEMLFNPFYDMQDDKIYVGDEFDVVGNEWMLEWSRHPFIRNWIKKNKDLLLLNCGVVGGSRSDMIGVCMDITSMYNHTRRLEIVEMPIFNYIIREHWNPRIVRGRQVTTIFKQYETASGAWWSHK